MPLSLTTKKLLLLFGGINYLIQDTFKTNLAAGSVNGTAADNGALRVVTDTGNNLAITGNAAVSSGIVGSGNPALAYTDKDGNAFARTPGLTLEWSHTWTVARGGGGFGNAVTTNNVGFTDAGGVLTTTFTNNSSYPIGTTATQYQLKAALFATGAALWVDSKMVWVNKTNTIDPVYPVPLWSRAVDSQMTVDNVDLRVRSNYSTAELLSTIYDSSPATDVNFAGDADGLYYLDIASLGAPSGGEKIQLHFRQSDSNNYWTAYLEYSGTQWDFKMDSVAAGTPTNRITAAGVGTPDGIAVVSDANTIYAFTGASGAYTKRGSTISNSFNATATEIGAWYDIGTMSLLRTFRRNSW